MKKFISNVKISKSSVLEKMKAGRNVIHFTLEITARCNNNCRHCYINLPADCKQANERELPLNDIKNIADNAVDLGALWCLITGGEPLLRKDFFDIYLYLKKKGILVSVFTNATLITKEHVDFFKKNPPRDIEITVYGITQKTYERVTRKPGSFKNFMRWLDLLLENGVKVRLKTTVLRSNVSELYEIRRFCNQRTKDYFRFDPFLELRFDGNEARNREIRTERLLPEEIVAIEKHDEDRSGILKNNCDKFINPRFSHTDCNHLFHCGAGNSNFALSYDGFFRICPSLQHKSCIYDLKKGNLKEAWQEFIPSVRDMCSNREEFINRCRKCKIINLCMWCPGRAGLETGEIDRFVDYFCEVAHARAAAFLKTPVY